MSSPGFTKRQKELRRQDKRREKEVKREQRKLEKEERGKAPVGDGEDPDLAGIIPGPQPIPD